jgi:arylsulfatase A-like enzyme
VRPVPWRGLLVLACLAGGCGEEASGGPGPAGPPAGRPERLLRGLVLISIDTLRSDRLGFNGYERDTTPNLDGVARRSVVFGEARSQASQTAPSHASLFTSTYVGAHGLYNVHAEDSQVPVLPPGVVTLAEALSAAGIETAAFVSGGNLTRSMGMDRGFAVWDEHNEDVSGRVEALMRWLSKRGDAPFFAVLHTYQVHAPYVPPRDLAEKYTDPAYTGELRATYERYLAMSPQEAWTKGVGPDYWGREMVDYTEDDVRFLSDLYDGEVAHVDAELRRLFEKLLTGPQAADLGLIVLGDHGEEFRDHGKFQHDQLFDELVHVPLFVDAGAKLERQGWKGRVDAPVALVDVAPTIAELLGVAPVGEAWSGRSLVPLMRPDTRPAAEARDDAPMFSELVRDHGRHEYRSITWHGWKYIRHRQLNIDRTWEHLFDLGADPHEQFNLIERSDGEAPAQLARLRTALDEFEARNAESHERLGQANPVDLSPEQREQLNGLGYTGEGGR